MVNINGCGLGAVLSCPLTRIPVAALHLIVLNLQKVDQSVYLISLHG